MSTQRILQRPMPGKLVFAIAVLAALVVFCFTSPRAGEFALARGESAETGIYDAAHQGDVTKLRRLFRDGAPLASQHSVTPLVAAAVMGQTEAVRYLLQHGAAADTPAASSQALFLAIGQPRRSLEMIDWLLAHGADPNMRSNNGLTALMAAAWSDDEASARRLLAAGAELDAEDDDGLTAMAYATASGRHRVRELLQEAGAAVPVSHTSAAGAGRKGIATH